jgi:PiT family inorganic phosphate transporter
VTALVVVVALALLFDLTNGFHDAANSVAALVATRAARPGPALALVACCHVAGPLLVGTAVADTVGGVVVLEQGRAFAVVGAAVTAAIAWNLLTWWRGLPSSSSHALVGGLVGAALAESGTGAVHWGGVAGRHVDGVLGALAALALSPLLGALAGLVLVRAGDRLLRRARSRVETGVRRAEWVSAGALALSHGANDAQKTMGVITLALLASGHLSVFAVPLWVKLAAAASLTIGTSLGGWRIVRTVGRGIYRMRPLDGLASQTGSAGVILVAALVGAPVSTTHVVAASVVGVGGARRHHVRWRVAREMVTAWVVTLPVTAVLGAAALAPWRWWT